ncbi:hypothetical protein [Weissella confusa]|uniref:hypothetical protein n=1 Tax=Weissella confusa TaxID=1583 RepID=UPI000A7310D1|nr:hypothetical protein [Weissella confusa]
MLKYVHTSWLHFVLVYIAIMLDGGIALYFAPVLFKMPMSASPYLSLIVMMMPVLTGTVTQMKERSLYIAAFLGGLLFDYFLFWSNWYFNDWIPADGLVSKQTPTLPTNIIYVVSGRLVRVDEYVFGV